VKHGLGVVEAVGSLELDGIETERATTRSMERV